MIGILVVSHSGEAASGIARVARETSGSKVDVRGVGGNEDGGLGVPVSPVFDALTEMLGQNDGVLILPDLGSSVLSSRSAIALLPPEDASRVAIANAPVLEGAVLASVEASIGSPLEKVEATAVEARNLDKTN